MNIDLQIVTGKIVIMDHTNKSNIFKKLNMIFSSRDDNFTRYRSRSRDRFIRRSRSNDKFQRRNRSNERDP